MASNWWIQNYAEQFKLNKEGLLNLPDLAVELLRSRIILKSLKSDIRVFHLKPVNEFNEFLLDTCRTILFVFSTTKRNIE